MRHNSHICICPAHKGPAMADIQWPSNLLCPIPYSVQAKTLNQDSLMTRNPSFVRAALAVSIAAILAACASNNDESATWSPDKLYEEARSEMGSTGYEKAITLFERLEGRAAGTPLAQQAQLEKAYAQYKDGQRAQAVATLDRFLRLHPTSPAADYALYLKGIVNFNDSLGILNFLSKRDLSERDQRAAKESFEAFKTLTERHPDSKYAADAHQRMVYIVNSLAAYDVHVARYYYSRGAYVAAISRAQQAIQDYKEAPSLLEALQILERSYDALGMTELRDDTRRVIQASFPDGSAPADGKSSSWWRFWDK